MRLGGALIVCFLSCASLAACGGVRQAEKVEGTPAFSIAVFPLENLSGSPVPLKSIRSSLSEELVRRGFHVLDEDTLERFLVRHRVRYTAGIDDETARSLKDETGAGGALLTSVELYTDLLGVPKIALSSRLVSTGGAPAILWADGVGLAGDDHPGILGIGLISDLHLLLREALGAMGDSLSAGLSREGGRRETEKAARKFQPRIVYRSTDLDWKQRYRVTIAPFFNKSTTKYAGDILLLRFLGALQHLGNFEVVEPGLVRETFLNLRIIMDEGVSLEDARVLFSALGADLVLAGEVLDYQDYQGPAGTAKVGFAVQLMERKSRKVVWSSESWNWGDEGVFFFDLGRVNTAHAIAERMAESIGELLVKR